jgi:hypothetical protein
VLAEVAQHDAGGEAIADQLVGRLGEKSLSSVSNSQQAGHAVERRAYIVAVLHFSEAGVKGNSDSESGPFRALIGVK